MEPREKPTLHGRHHLLGGADPIIGMVPAGAEWASLQRTHTTTVTANDATEPSFIGGKMRVSNPDLFSFDHATPNTLKIVDVPYPFMCLAQSAADVNIAGSGGHFLYRTDAAGTFEADGFNAWLYSADDVFIDLFGTGGATVYSTTYGRTYFVEAHFSGGTIQPVRGTYSATALISGSIRSGGPWHMDIPLTFDYRTRFGVDASVTNYMIRAAIWPVQSIENVTTTGI